MLPDIQKWMEERLRGDGEWASDTVDCLLEGLGNQILHYAMGTAEREDALRYQSYCEIGAWYLNDHPDPQATRTLLEEIRRDTYLLVSVALNGQRYDDACAIISDCLTLITEAITKAFQRNRPV